MKFRDPSSFLVILHFFFALMQHGQQREYLMGICNGIVFVIFVAV